MRNPIVIAVAAMFSLSAAAQVIITEPGLSTPVGEQRVAEIVAGIVDTAVTNHAAAKATTNSLGHVIVGAGLTVDGDGVVSSPRSVPTWSDVTDKPAAITNYAENMDQGVATTDSPEFAAVTTPFITFTNGVTLSYSSDERNQALVFSHPDGGIVTINGETYRMWKNKDTAAITNGQPVCLYSAGGRLGSMRLADADAEGHHGLVGVYTTSSSLPPDAIGRVVFRGGVESIDLDALCDTAYSEGDPLYLSTNKGRYTTTKPSAPVEAIIVGHVSYSNGGPQDIEVAVDNIKAWADLDARYAPIAEPVFTNAQAYIENAMSAGRMWGGAITVTGTTINVAAGGGVCKDDTVSTLSDIPTSANAGFGAQLTYKTFPQTELTAVEGYNIIFFDCSANAVTNILKEDFFDLFNVSQDFTLGRVYYEPSYGVVSRLCGMNNWSAQRRNQIYHDLKAAVEVVDGGVPSASGLKIAVSASRLVAEGYDHFSSLAKGADDPFTYWYQINGVWTNTGVTDITNTVYNVTTGDADGLAAMAANKWKAEYVYLVHDGSVHVVMGQAVYNTQSLAEDAAVPTPAGLLSGYAALIGRVTIKTSETAMTLDATATTLFSAGAVPEHNSLAGLNDGDSYEHLTQAEKGTLVTTNETDAVALQSTLSVAGAATFDSSVTATSYSITGNRTAITAATQIGTNATYAIDYADGYEQVFGFSSTNDLALTLTGPGAGYRSQVDVTFTNFTYRAVTWPTNNVNWINTAPTGAYARVLIGWDGTNAALINKTWNGQ